MERGSSPPRFDGVRVVGSFSTNESHYYRSLAGCACSAQMNWGESFVFFSFFLCITTRPTNMYSPAHFRFYFVLPSSVLLESKSQQFCRSPRLMVAYFDLFAHSCRTVSTNTPLFRPPHRAPYPRCFDFFCTISLALRTVGFTYLGGYCSWPAPSLPPILRPLIPLGDVYPVFIDY